MQPGFLLYFSSFLVRRATGHCPAAFPTRCSGAAATRRGTTFGTALTTYIPQANFLFTMPHAERPWRWFRLHLGLMPRASRPPGFKHVSLPAPRIPDL